jgi:hypothetical protein
VSTNIADAIRTRLTAERMAGNQPVLTFDEVVMLGGEVDGGHIERYGKTVSALIDEHGTDIIPDDETPDRTSPEAMAEDLDAFVTRRDAEQADRRAEGRYRQLSDQHKDTIAAEAKRYGVDEHTALGYIVTDSVARLRSAGKGDEADAEVAAWKWGSAAAKPKQSIQDKVTAALAEQVAQD